MSSTKIVIVVLVLIIVLFLVFVMVGAFSDDQPKAGNRNDAAEFTKQRPGWTDAIGGLVSSFKPKIELKRKIYSENAEEDIGPDEKQPFRTATFHLIRGSAVIEYEDRTEDLSEELKKELKEQKCEFPNLENEKDPSRCSIVALKKGGKLTFRCRGNEPCRVEVE